MFRGLWISHLAQQSHASCGAPAATAHCPRRQKATRSGWVRTLVLAMCQADPRDQPSAPPRGEQMVPSLCININPILTDLAAS